MKEKKTQSFWDMPEWYRRWRHSAAYWYILFIILVAKSAQNAYSGRYAQAYAWISPFIIAGMAYLIERLAGRSGSKSVSCLSVTIATPIVGLLGYLIFGNALLSFDNVTHKNPAGTSAGQVMLIASVVMAAWLLIILVARLTELSTRSQFSGSRRPKPCSICGQLTNLILTVNSKDKRFCREHFLETLRKATDEYNGKLIIVDRDLASKSKQAQYVFYEPDALTEDSYTESDVQSVKRLIDRLLSGDAFAAKIPNASVKDIGSWDEKPLLIIDPEHITAESLNKDALLLYLENVVSAFDGKNFEFQMNLPHSENGIYLWHNYV